MDRNSYKKERKRQKNNLETDDEEGDSSSSFKQKKYDVKLPRLIPKSFNNSPRPLPDGFLTSFHCHYQ